MNRTYKYRLYPTKSQEDDLVFLLNVTRNIYNMALSERRLEHKVNGKKLSKYDQHKWIPKYRALFLSNRKVSTQMLRTPINDLDEAFKGFFRRLKNGEAPGYPRFRTEKSWRGIGFPTYGNGCKIKGRRLRVVGVGNIRVRWHRPISGEIKTCRIARRGSKWFASFSCNIEKPKPLPATNSFIGIDLGISSLITTSDGKKYENQNFYKNLEQRVSRLDRKASRCVRGSNNYIAIRRTSANLAEHIKNQRKDFLNKLANDIIKENDIIAVENLTITNMARNRNFSKSILDAGWGYFRQRLIDKAEEAGREVVLVNPAYTSKTCSSCGATFEDLTLSDRWVTCECGLSLDRDHNAAINILSRAGRGTTMPHNVTGYGERASKAS